MTQFTLHDLLLMKSAIDDYRQNLEMELDDPIYTPEENNDNKQLDKDMEELFNKVQGILDEMPQYHEYVRAQIAGEPTQ